MVRDVCVLQWQKAWANKGPQEYFKISEVPAALLYKDGELVKKVEGRNAAGMNELIALMG